MKEGLLWRISTALLVLVLAAIYLLPSLPNVRESSFSKFLPDARVNLGLDLMGGIYLTLGVDVDKAVENSLTQEGQNIRAVAKDKDILLPRPRYLPGEKLEFALTDASRKKDLDELLAKNFPQLNISASTDSGTTVYTASFKSEERNRLSEMALDQALKTIRNRIDQFGVSEPDIRKLTDAQRIVIQLPGIKDAQRAIQIVGKTAHLEFHLVRTDVDSERAAKGALPLGTQVLPMLSRAGGGQEIPVVVDKDAVLTGEYITDAKARPDPDHPGRAYVMLSLNSHGATLFERITGENRGRQLAIVLDGKVYSAPVIQDKIAGGNASITGTFTMEEANDLALVLRAGSLPAPVTVLEERTVGPSLGQESIDMGVTAALIGGSAVMIFMIIYYGLSGVIATVMLILDIWLLLAGMAAFGATLTLPGIAGIVLTLGMAVDANVLIFERIREEMRKGLTPAAATGVGFSRATLTITDSNLTTVIAAVILYQFGTGPIRGFAVTLTLGIIVSMFTAIFVSRIVFDLWVNKNTKSISI